MEKLTLTEILLIALEDSYYNEDLFFSSDEDVNEDAQNKLRKEIERLREEKDNDE